MHARALLIILLVFASGVVPDVVQQLRLEHSSPWAIMAAERSLVLFGLILKYLRRLGDDDPKNDDADPVLG